MSYIPADAKWYLADAVEAIEVSGHRTLVVHINTLLVRADSPQEAYQKALELGRQGLGKRGRRAYKNAAGETVTTSFLGLRDLNVVHDELEHGAELSYRVRHVRSVSAAKKLVTAKPKLGVFTPMTPPTGPDFMPADIRRELEGRFGPIGARTRKKGQKRTRKSRRGAPFRL